MSTRISSLNHAFYEEYLLFHFSRKEKKSFLYRLCIKKGSTFLVHLYCGCVYVHVYRKNENSTIFEIFFTLYRHDC